MNSSAENISLCLVYTVLQKLLESCYGKTMGIVEEDSLGNH